MSRKLKEWDILDFPETIYVKIKDNFRKKLFNQLYEKFGSKRKTAKYLNINLRTLLNYERGFSIKYKIKYSQSIPLKLLKKIIDSKNKFKLEKNILAISVRAGLEIKKLKLPLKETPKLYSIIGHMIADGCQAKSHPPYYANSDKTLREKFIEKLSLFGNFRTREIKTKTTSIIEFPKAISDIIQHLFDFQITHPNRIPKLIFSSSKECKSSFTGALFDDDGSFSKEPNLTIHNLNLIKQVKELLENLDIKTNKIVIFKYGYKKDKVSLPLSSRSLENFHNTIPIECPHKKLSMEYKIKIRNRKERTRNPILLKKEILKILKDKPSKTLEIANSLLFTHGGAIRHLNKLEKEGIIQKNGYKNKIIWSVNQGLIQDISQ